MLCCKCLRRRSKKRKTVKFDSDLDQVKVIDVDMAETIAEQHHVVKALNEYKEKLGFAEDDNFYQKLIDGSLDTIANRLHSQVENIPNESLHNHIIEIFQPFTDDVPMYRNQKLLSTQRETCVLTVIVERAENLAPKDVSGTSDPYCLLGLSPKETYKNLQGKIKKYTQKTNFKQATLNPEWNETFKFKVQRSDVNNLTLHMHVWDYDDTDDTMTSALGRVKDIKNIAGLGRIVKDVAQTVSSSTDQDDFMGFALMPLREITFGSTSKWFDLRSHSTLERISGKIKVSVHLTCPHHSVMPDIPYSYSIESLLHDDDKLNGTDTLSHCAMFGGLVTVTVASAHRYYKDVLMQQGEKSSTTCDGWNGSIGNLSQRLLDEFKSQRCVSDKQDVISRWHAYTWEHIQLREGLKLKFMTDLMSELEEVCKKEEVSEDVVDSHVPDRFFTMDNLPTSFEEFVNHEKNKIVLHRKLYPVKQDDTIIKTGELLLCFRTLRNMKLYMTLKMIDTTMKSSSDVRNDVIASLKISAKNLFDESCVEFKVFGANILNINEDSDMYEEYNVVGIARLVSHLNQALVDGYSYYHGVYEKVLNINYIATMKDVIIPLLYDGLQNVLDKINESIVTVIDIKDKKAEERASGMFSLYQNLKYLSSFLTKLSTNQHNLNNNIIKENRDHVNPETFEGYHNWFRPTLLRWLQISRLKTLDNLRSAVKVDKVDRLDNIAKHSSSSVDAVACLTAITTIWQKLDWPDAVDCFVLVTRITSDVATAVEHYADLIHDKLKSVGFFDDEGQFDVTEELCFALNNLEKVKAFLQKLPSDLNIEKVASKIDLMEQDNIDGEKFKSTFHALLRNAEVEMRRKMLIVIAIVGKKLLPDVTKYLEAFCEDISDDEDDKTNWKPSVDVSIAKLSKYLAENISTLFQWLCESNFRLLLDVLWRVCLRSFQDVVLEKQDMRRPLFFKKLRYVLSDHINEFYYADGLGIPREAMQTCETFLYVDAELQLKGAKSVDLMRLFYAEMYEKQCQETGGSEFGYLNINAWYERNTEELHVDVVSAENLVSLDVNGFSDPFVKLRLAPKMMFPKTRTFQTLVEKKTLNPVYKNEKFTFKLARQYVQQEGAVIIFTVLDHDIITSNDLEGEAALPLHILDGVSEKTQSRTYKLKLSQPTPSPKKPWYDVYLKKLPTAVSDDDVSDVLDKGRHKSRTYATPLSLLNCRVDYDRDASEFCRWRAKLEQAMQERSNRLQKS